MNDGFAVFGMMVFGLIMIPVLIMIVCSFIDWVKAFARGDCLNCHGAGGWDNPLLFFSRYSWETCRKCNGTGKRT